jgi:hypothetical protein
MSDITWFEALPSDDSLVSVAPRDLRSLWTSIAAGLGESLFYAGSGGASQLSSGELRPGATRTFFGALSASSNDADNLGRLFFSSDSSFVFLYESDRTHKIGGPGTVSHMSSPLGAVWIEQRGTVSADEGDVGTSFTTAYTDVAPQVWIAESRAAAGGDAWLRGVLSVSTSGFTVTSQYIGAGVAGPDTVRWTSLGTISVGEF